MKRTRTKTIQMVSSMSQRYIYGDDSPKLFMSVAGKNNFKMLELTSSITIFGKENSQLKVINPFLYLPKLYLSMIYQIKILPIKSLKD